MFTAPITGTTIDLQCFMPARSPITSFMALKPNRRKVIPCLDSPLDTLEDLFSKDSLTEDDLEDLGVRQRHWRPEPGFEQLNLED